MEPHARGARASAASAVSPAAGVPRPGWAADAVAVREHEPRHQPEQHEGQVRDHGDRDQHEQRPAPGRPGTGAARRGATAARGRAGAGERTGRSAKTGARSPCGPRRPHRVAALVELVLGQPADGVVLTEQLHGRLTVGVTEAQRVHHSSSELPCLRAGVLRTLREQPVEPPAGVPEDLDRLLALVRRAGRRDLDDRSDRLADDLLEVDRLVVVLLLGERRPDGRHLLGVLGDVGRAGLGQLDGLATGGRVLDEPLVLQLGDGRVDRAGARLPHAVGPLGDLLDHLVAVDRLRRGVQHVEDGRADVATAYRVTVAARHVRRGPRRTRGRTSARPTAAVRPSGRPRGRPCHGRRGRRVVHVLASATLAASGFKIWCPHWVSHVESSFH